MSISKIIDCIFIGILIAIQVGAVVLMVCMANWALSIGRPEGAILAGIFGLGFLCKAIESICDLGEKITEKEPEEQQGI